jgi:hypothetical protein
LDPSGGDGDGVAGLLGLRGRHRVGRADDDAERRAVVLQRGRSAWGQGEAHCVLAGGAQAQFVGALLALGQPQAGQVGHGRLHALFGERFAREVAGGAWQSDGFQGAQAHRHRLAPDVYVRDVPHHEGPGRPGCLIRHAGIIP